MDDFIDTFLPTPTWPANAPNTLSLAGNAASGSDNLLANSVEACERDGRNRPRYMQSTNHIVGNASIDHLKFHEHNDTSSIFINENLEYGIDKGLRPGCTISQHKLHKQLLQPQLQDIGTSESCYALPGVIECDSASGSFSSEFSSSCPIALPHSALAVSNFIESNGSQLSVFPHADTNSISSASAIWPSSYPTGPAMGQRKSQTFGFQGVESDDVLRKTCTENSKFSEIDYLASPSLDNHKFHNNHVPSLTAGQLIKEPNGLHNIYLSSFASGPQMTFTKPNGVQTPQQSIDGNPSKHRMDNSFGTQSQLGPMNGNGCNGAIKPRVRARRGQATDPHSIAERLRREKIAERMKNLQELVPNSNKADKASMLDEIIDYVKFLQLQVKVLSMSRLGAAGAVVPLLTDSQSEGSGSLLLSSSSVGQGLHPSESQDSLAFEQEVVKLMESNVTTAMQYLQNKGLCLMPVALAAAISNQKGSSSSAIPPEGSKPGLDHDAISNCSWARIESSAAEDGASGCSGAVVGKESSEIY
ncbi:uncharacterized protein [Typha latifolia]|uniref:uncharacterized protein isoform X1 n=1 Tax=Typha latifolia TaxID=4733 RepID=UPI003C2F159B